MIDFKIHGDLIKDKLGNYYLVVAQSGNKLSLVNAVVKFAFSRILNDDYLREHHHEYVGFFPTQLLKNHIENITSGKNQLKIYILDSLIADGYDIVVDGIYEVSPETLKA